MQTRSKTNKLNKVIIKKSIKPVSIENNNNNNNNNNDNENDDTPTILLKTKKYDAEISDRFSTRNGKITKRIIQITPLIPNENISLADVKRTYNSLITKNKISEKNVYIQVMAERELTLKSLGQTNFKDWDNEEYYKNKAEFHDGTRLNNFAYVRICILD